jgi:hypothetical protein
VRKLVKAGVQVEGFAVLGDNPDAYAFLTIGSPGGRRTVSLSAEPVTLPALPAALQHEIRMVLRPWEDADRNGFDLTGDVKRGLAV